MSIELLIWPAIVLCFLTSFILLMSRDWRWITIALGVQYFCVFVFVGQTWPLEQAAVKLVTGWMVAAVLGSTRLGTPAADAAERLHPPGGVFRLFAGSLVALIVISNAPKMVDIVADLTQLQAVGSSLLIGMGLLILGLTSQPLRVVLGLLVAFSGFEVVYAVVEPSALVAGLLTGVNFGLALLGAYLFLVADMDASEEIG